jgi:hypothetical protein
MTSIVSLLAGPFVQHASDRLVTVRRGDDTHPYDAAANKAILFVAQDAVVAIGYTGTAYLDGAPTDPGSIYQPRVNRGRHADSGRGLITRPEPSAESLNHLPC